MDPHFEGVIFQTHASELVKRLGNPFPPFCVVDIRNQSAYQAGHLPTAQHTSTDQLAQGLPDGTEASTEFFVIGDGPDDPTIRQATQALRSHGAQRVVEFRGGMDEWRDYGFDVVRETAA